MKIKKKHFFKYQDPEKNSINVYETKVPTKLPEKQAASLKLVPDYVFKDLKQTLTTIAIFVIILVLLYFVQEKTGFLKPVLKLFNL